MNLYLHGIKPNIILGDTIYEPLSPIRYNCVLTNPPFGTKGANQIPEREDFKIKTSNKQLNFVQHVYSCLQHFGRAAIILPDNVLFEDKGTDLWKYLMDLCNVHTIMRLPKGTFAPYAPGVNANVIFLQKGLPTKYLWIFDARTNIEGITKRGRPLLEKHFREFEKCYGNDPNGNSKRVDLGEEGRFRKFTLEQLTERKFNLDISWTNDEVPFNNPDDITSEKSLEAAIISLQKMVKNIKGLLNILEK